MQKGVIMTELNYGTKAREHYIQQVEAIAYDGRTLANEYKSWSDKKQRAYEWCLKRAREFDAIKWGVLTGNSDHFTFAFEFVDKETGVIRLVIETYCHEYIMDR